jgi:NitT/TauT family transport system ATP-binding protein
MILKRATQTTFSLNDLEVKGVRHHFEDGLLALDGVSFALAPATFTCLVGPSGCGKSTLLRIVAGLLQPEEGVAKLDGTVISHPQRQVGIVFQAPSLLPWRTVEANLMLPLEISGVPRREQRQRAAKMLDRLGLSDFRKAYPAALSGGMAQRLSIGRALINNPSVLLLDEPFGALDALTREQVSAELLRLWAVDQKTVLMVTHSIQEAVLLADRVLVMSPRPGHIVADIPISLERPRELELITDPTFVRLEAEIRAALRLA